MRLVIIENPFKTLRTSKLARSIFGEIFSVRFEQFEHDFDMRAIPAGEADFISDHVVLLNDDMEVLIAMQFVGKDRCDKHNIKLPIYHLFKGSALDTANSYVKNAKSICYGGGLVKSRKFRDLSVCVAIIGKAILNMCHHGYNELIAAASPKSHQAIESLGCRQLISGPVRSDKFNEGLFIEVMDDMSQAGEVFNKQADKLWSQRIVISEKSEAIKKAA